MWEEEKKKKGKTERLFSNGVIILIFLILAAQSVFFTKHIIDNRRDQRAADTAGNAAVHNIPQKPDIQKPGPENGSRDSTGKHGSDAMPCGEYCRRDRPGQKKQTA